MNDRSAPKGRRILLVAPCRDEAKFMRRTLDSVMANTVKPTLWVIIDDGSTDDTPKILAEYAAKFPCIKIVTRKDRGERAVGPGVIEAFYAGLETVNLADFDYVCKIDLDLDLPPRYFENLIERMEADPRIGTCSGKPYYPHPETGQLISEGCGDETSVGMTKFYRTDCFQQIGGFVRQVMWDGIDNHRCRMLGWRAVSWDEPEIRFTHLRPMGSSQVSLWTGRKRHGFGQYFMGTGPVYMFASAVFRAARRPFLVGGLGMLAGYFAAARKRVHRYDDLDFRRFLRKYQWACLLKGKPAATKALDDTWQNRARPVS
jgi:glycosyltransferase involved in cell wall biosynthesis